MYIYKRTEPNLYTVGTTDGGGWDTDSDWPTKEKAADRCHFLNGGDASLGELIAAIRLLHHAFYVEGSKKAIKEAFSKTKSILSYIYG